MYAIGGALYTKHLLSKIEKETTLPSVSRRVDSLELAFAQYNNRISELEHQKSELAGKVSTLEQEITNAQIRQYNTEVSLLEESLNFQEYRKEQTNAWNIQAKQDVEQNEKLDLLEEDTKDYKLKIIADKARLNAKIEPLETAVQSLAKTSETKWASYNADRNVYQASIARTEELVKSIRELKQEYSSLKESYSELKKSQSSQEESDAFIKVEINSISKKIEDLEMKLRGTTNK